MASNSLPRSARKSKSPARRIYDFLSGMHLATITLLLLLLLTWLATLEQIDHGLHPTLNKFFSWKSPWLIPDMVPEINGKKLPIFLPGGYYVCAVLLINMTLGGIIRLRKGWSQVGNLISHFGIIYMLIAGAVAHHFSERGNMAVFEGESADVAEAYNEFVVEVAEVKDKKRDKFHVIRGKYLTPLVAGNPRIFDFDEIPFSLEISGYLANAIPANHIEHPRRNNELIADGYYLQEARGNVESERNLAACYARLVYEDGKKSDPFILSGAAFQTHTVEVNDRIFTIDMRKRLWPMPFLVELDTFKAEFHPGTGRPKKFVSDIRRTENGQESKVTIQMNEPMRYEGLTFFQASYGPPGARPGEKMYSVFEIVRNPADKWPEYSLYVVAFGMLVTFLTKLGKHLSVLSKKRKNEN